MMYEFDEEGNLVRKESAFQEEAKKVYDLSTVDAVNEA